MFELIKYCLGAVILVAANLIFSVNAETVKLPPTAGVGTEAVTTFDPSAALCERQTFRLETLEEVQIWYRYIAGLRTAETSLPAGPCNSSTLRAIESILTSKDRVAAKGMLIGLIRLYVSSSMTPDSIQRALDRSGTFRYRNDATALSLLWLMCPENDSNKKACVIDIVSDFPDQYLETSPVFCDFAKPNSDVQNVEFSIFINGIPAEFPGVCVAVETSQPIGVTGSREAWINKVAFMMLGTN